MSEKKSLRSGGYQKYKVSFEGDMMGSATLGSCEREGRDRTEEERRYAEFLRAEGYHGVGPRPAPRPGRDLMSRPPDDNVSLTLPIPGHDWRVHLHVRGGGSPALVAILEEEPSGRTSVSTWVPDNAGQSGHWSPPGGPSPSSAAGSPELREAIRSLLGDPRSILLSLEVMAS